jgi:hypothetical protein
MPDGAILSPGCRSAKRCAQCSMRKQPSQTRRCRCLRNAMPLPAWDHAQQRNIPAPQTARAQPDLLGQLRTSSSEAHRAQLIEMATYATGRCPHVTVDSIDPKSGSSGWIRTSNPPVNSVMQVFGLAGSRGFSSGGRPVFLAVRHRIVQTLCRQPHRQILEIQRSGPGEIAVPPAPKPEPVASDLAAAD